MLFVIKPDICSYKHEWKTSALHRTFQRTFQHPPLLKIRDVHADISGGSKQTTSVALSP
jgi:hypothetical protein